MQLDSAVFYSNNIEAVVTFYRDVIGLEVEFVQSDRFASFIFSNGVRLGIKKKAEEREVPGRQTIFIGVEDIEEYYTKFKEMKANFYKELTEESWGKQFSILDPDNYKVLFRTKR